MIAPAAVPTTEITEPSAAPVRTAAPNPTVAAVPLSTPACSSPALTRCPAPAPTTPAPAATGRASAAPIRGVYRDDVAAYFAAVKARETSVASASATPGIALPIAPSVPVAAELNVAARRPLPP